MQLTLPQIKSLMSSGTVVVYRHVNKLLTEEVMPAFLLATYDGNIADLKTIGGDYYLQKIPYDRNLDTKGSWCHKRDLITTGEPAEESLPDIAPEADDGLSAETAVPEADTGDVTPSEETMSGPTA